MMKTTVRNLSKAERRLIAEEVGLSEPNRDIPIYVCERGEIKGYGITSKMAIEQFAKEVVK